VTIGEMTTIWHFCHVLGDVAIGRALLDRTERDDRARA
jgi:hypothetical protein